MACFVLRMRTVGTEFLLTMGPAPETKESTGSMRMRYSSLDVVRSATKDNAKTRLNCDGQHRTSKFKFRFKLSLNWSFEVSAEA